VTGDQYDALLSEAPKTAKAIDNAMKKAGLDGWSRLAYGKILFEHILNNA
jgi:hypothetical protein